MERLFLLCKVIRAISLSNCGQVELLTQPPLGRYKNELTYVELVDALTELCFNVTKLIEHEDLLYCNRLSPIAVELSQLLESCLSYFSSVITN